MHVSSNFEKDAQVLLSYLGAKLHSGIVSRRWKPCYLQISGCSAHRHTLNTSHFFCNRGINRSFSTVYESFWQPAECDSTPPLLNRKQGRVENKVWAAIHFCPFSLYQRCHWNGLPWVPLSPWDRFWPYPPSCHYWYAFSPHSVSRSSSQLSCHFQLAMT